MERLFTQEMKKLRSRTSITPPADMPKRRRLWPFGRPEVDVGQRGPEACVTQTSTLKHLLRRNLNPGEYAAPSGDATWGKGRGRNTPASPSPLRSLPLVPPLFPRAQLSQNPADTGPAGVSYLWHGKEHIKVEKSRNRPQCKQAQEWHSRKIPRVSPSLCPWCPIQKLRLPGGSQRDEGRAGSSCWDVAHVHWVEVEVS